MGKRNLCPFRSIVPSGGVGPSTDPARSSDLAVKAMAGQDMQEFPEYWVPYAQRRAEVLARAQTLEKFRAAEPRMAAVVEDDLARSGKKAADARYLLLRARNAWVVVLVDPATAEPLKMLVAEKI